MGTLALSDGRLLSWSEDNTLRLWTANSVPLAELQGHTSRVVGTLALSDGRLLSWGEDSTLRLWAADGVPLVELQGHKNGVTGALALSDGRLLSWSEDSTLRLWTADGVPLAELRGHMSWVTGALALSDGRLLSWSGDSTLRLWAADGVPLAMLSQPKWGDRGVIAQWANIQGVDPIEIFADDPSNSADAGIGRENDACLVLYDKHSGQILSRFYADASVTAPVFLSDGVTLAAGDERGRVLFLHWRGTAPS